MKFNKKNISTYFLCITLFFGLLTCSAAAKSSTQKIPNTTIKIFVQYRLAKEGILTNNNIHVKVKHNTITLEGKVPTLYKRSLAAKEAGDVEDSYSVINNIRVVAPDVPDSVVTKNVTNRIWSNVFYGIFDWVKVHDKNGIVTLDGWVHLPWYKTQFQTETEKVVGVKSVKNNIKITFGPGMIGRRAAWLIYNDPMYTGMEYLKDPPIHIIVNNGTVFLEGKVDSSGEAAWASNLVEFNTNAIRVKDYLQVD